MNEEGLRTMVTQADTANAILELRNWLKAKIEPFIAEMEILHACHARETKLVGFDITSDKTLIPIEGQIDREFLGKLEELDELFRSMFPPSGRAAEQISVEARLREVLSQKNYELCENLARGRNVAVYRAKDNFGNEVIVKLMTSADFGKLEALAEINLLHNRTKHENVIQVYDSYTEKNPYFIITEYAKGNSLRDILRIFHAMPFYMALEVLTGICAGCQFLRKKGIKAANFNPENILMTDETMPLLSPFSYFRSEQPTFLLKNFVKYASYQSPERLCEEPENLSPELLEKADMFSIALIGYELLTGEALFGGHTIYEVIGKRWKFFNTDTRGRFEVLNKIKNYPKLRKLFAAMLEPDPKDRPENLKEVIDALARLKPVLSNEHRIALESYQRCMNNLHGDFVEVFYNNLFGKFGWTRDKFPDPARQRRKLRSSVKLFLESGSDASFVEKLPTMSSHHGLTLENFMDFIDLFVDNIHDFDDQWGKKMEIAAAWESLKQQFYTALKNALKNNTEPLQQQ